MGLFDSSIDRRLNHNNQLIKLSLLIDWNPIRIILEKVHNRDELIRSGGFSYNKLKMFKAILLGQWHSLSDAKLEEALNVRLDFMRFCGFELDDQIPDYSSLNRFRNKLIQRKLEEKLFAEVNHQLEKHQLKVNKAEAAIIDATVIESGARPRRVLEASEDRNELLELSSDTVKPEESASTNYEVVESCDKDAKWLKKGKRSYYGYNAFLSVDSGDGYINDIHVTPANVSEMNEFDEITKNVNAKRVLSDKGYASTKNRDSLRARGLINRKKVQRLMKIAGIKAIFPGPKTSIPGREASVFPYLLKDLEINRANQVWAVDITYIKLPVGMVYLFALIDWRSRFIVAHKLVNTMEAIHAIETIDAALILATPEICNADQGSQFTGSLWIDKLNEYNIRISHDGVGRCIDNIRIERFWRTIKYEDIFIQSYATLVAARQGIKAFIEHYNYNRPHQALDYKTPSELYFGNAG